MGPIHSREPCAPGNLAGDIHRPIEVPSGNLAETDDTGWERSPKGAAPHARTSRPGRRSRIEYRVPTHRSRGFGGARPEQGRAQDVTAATYLPLILSA